MKDYNDKSGLVYYWLEANIDRVLLVVLFACLGLWGLLLEGQEGLNLGRRLVRGMGPELAGIVIAAVTIDALAKRRQDAERKKVLIAQLGSGYRDVTEMAIIELRNRGWMYDGSLRGASLGKANLSGAKLSRADLRNAWLEETILSHAFLDGANLSGAVLWEADLREAYLKNADLSAAKLFKANMSGALAWFIRLRDAQLTTVDMSNAMLEGADLSGAKLSGDLTGAYLAKATMKEADLFFADLKSANLAEVELDGANMWFANFSNVTNWTIDQLNQANTVMGSMMPDGAKIGIGQEEDSMHADADGILYEDWVV